MWKGILPLFPSLDGGAMSILNEMSMSELLKSIDENSLPFKGKGRVGMGLFSNV